MDNDLNYLFYKIFYILPVDNTIRRISIQAVYASNRVPRERLKYLSIENRYKYSAYLKQLCRK